MYHIVYLTTNLQNGKFYVGVHSTYNLEDGYLGSGDKIKLAIQKYGKKNFKRQILHFCLTIEDAYDWEHKIVDQQFISDKKTYNVDVGGKGSMKGRKHTAASKLKMSLAGLGRKRSLESIQKTAAGHKGKKISAEHKQKLSLHRTGKKLSTETKLKISLAKKGKTYEEIYGEEKAIELKKNRSDKIKETYAKGNLNNNNKGQNNPGSKSNTTPEKLKLKGQKVGQTRKAKGLAKGQLNNGSSQNMAAEKRIAKNLKGQLTRSKLKVFVVNEKLIQKYMNDHDIELINHYLNESGIKNQNWTLSFK